MALRSDRFGTRGDTAAFTACLLLSLIALAMPNGLRDPIAGWLRGTVLLPGLTAQQQAVRGREYRRSVDALRAERDSLALSAMDLPELRLENARLRRLLGLGPRLGTGFVSAEVLRQPGVADGLTLVLNAGRNRGIQVLSPVIAPEGLVGLVRNVDEHTSVTLAWTHPDFRAGAMVDGQRVYGIVAARRGVRSGELMELRGVAYRDQLAPGTPVVTSGLGGVFPRGIPIGTVQGILSEAAGWERTYLLRPAVHPAAATHVMILAAGAPDTLTALFADSVPAAPRDSAPPRRRSRPPAAPPVLPAPASPPDSQP